MSADVPRLPAEGRLAKALSEIRALVEHEGHRVLAEPAPKGAVHQLAYASRVDAEERWHLVRLREAGGYLFALRAEGPFPDPRQTAKLPDAARREVEKSFASFEVGKP